MATYETALSHLHIPPPAKSARIGITEKPLYSLVLRIDGSSPALAEVCTRAGYPLPALLASSGRLTTGLHCWISPDEYLLLANSAGKLTTIKRQLGKSLDGIHHALIDTSGAWQALIITGAERITLLRKLSSYNLQRQFPVGKVVATLLAGAPITLVHLDDKQILLLTRNSFADYVYRLITHAAAEFQPLSVPAAPSLGKQ